VLGLLFIAADALTTAFGLHEVSHMAPQHFGLSDD
jgi:hypothetical protein